MKKKCLITIVLAATLTLSSAFSSLAGQWMQDGIGWWWQEDDGSYTVNECQYINGKYYYFDENGYMLHDTMLGDFQIGSDGARVIPDLGLEEAPYKKQLDDIMNNVWRNYKNGVYENAWSPADGIGIAFGVDENSVIQWIDCGDYYKVNDVITLGFSYNNGYYEEWPVIGTLNELRVRKDAICFHYSKEGMNLNLSAEQWINNFEDVIGVSFGAVFDSKGYLVAINISCAS